MLWKVVRPPVAIHVVLSGRGRGFEMRQLVLQTIASEALQYSYYPRAVPIKFIPVSTKPRLRAFPLISAITPRSNPLFDVVNTYNHLQFLTNYDISKG